MTIRANLSMKSDSRIIAYVDDDVIRAWILDRMEDSIKHFITKTKKASPSAPFDYPAQVTGNMNAGITGPFVKGRSGRVDMSAENEQGVDYVPFHRFGTSRMAKRKLIPEALKEILHKRPKRDFLASAARFSVGRRV